MLYAVGIITCSARTNYPSFFSYSGSSVSFSCLLGPPCMSTVVVSGWTVINHTSCSRYASVCLNVAVHPPERGVRVRGPLHKSLTNLPVTNTINGTL